MSKVYLIPTFLAEGRNQTIPAYINDALKDCQAFFVENERTARRYLKSIWKDIVIDDYKWATIHKAENEVKNQFAQLLQQGKNIGIISEAGCPGVADPGQILVGVAHTNDAIVIPLVGPSSILLALMASGLNGQQFRFVGYLPIDNAEKSKALKQLENDSAKFSSTQIFIETPYRNNQMLEMILKTCLPDTRVCVAAELTSPNEWIKTMAVKDWKKNIPDLHKKPVVFLLLA